MCLGSTTSGNTTSYFCSFDETGYAFLDYKFGIQMFCPDKDPSKRKKITRAQNVVRLIM